MLGLSIEEYKREENNNTPVERKFILAIFPMDPSLSAMVMFLFGVTCCASLEMNLVSSDVLCMCTTCPSSFLVMPVR